MTSVHCSLQAVECVRCRAPAEPPTRLHDRHPHAVRGVCHPDAPLLRDIEAAYEGLGQVARPNLADFLLDEAGPAAQSCLLKRQKRADSNLWAISHSKLYNEAVALKAHRIVRAIDDAWRICVHCARMAKASRGPRAWRTACLPSRGTRPRLLEDAAAWARIQDPTVHCLTRDGHVAVCERCGTRPGMRDRARWCTSPCPAAFGP